MEKKECIEATAEAGLIMTQVPKHVKLPWKMPSKQVCMLVNSMTEFIGIPSLFLGRLSPLQ